MTWNELKEFCNNLPEKELKKKVIMWRESEAVTNIESMVLEQDHYIHPEYAEEGCITESEAKGVIEDEPDDYPEGIDEFKKVYDKGHPVLWEKF